MRGGTFGTLPAWALEALPTLSPTAVLVLVRLAYAARLRNPTVSRGELLDYTGRSPDQLARALRELQEAGHIQVTPGGYALAGARTDARTDARKNARTDARKNAACRAEKPRAERQKTVPEEVEEEEKEEYLASVQLGEGESGLREQPEKGGNGPANPGPASQEKNNQATGQGGELTAGPPPPPVPPAPPAPRAADYGDDDAAVRFFHDLAGYGFVMSNREHLARWHRDYSPEFLRLAWRLARQMPGVRVPAAGLVWLLNGEKPWPDELRAQFRRDSRAGGTPGAEDVPEIGEIRVLADGRSGRVTEVDADEQMLTLQVGQDAAECLWVPWRVTTPAVRRSA